MNRRVSWIILSMAALVILARLAMPFAIGKDQGFLLEAAERMVAGLGLTSTRSAHVPDISQQPLAEYMTWWPPLFSLLIAGGLAAGMPAAIALKTLFSLTTVAGWVGWARIAATLLTGPILIAGFRVPLHYLVAVFAPVFLTPRWNGTDIFLWAAVPWVLLPLSKMIFRDRPLAGSAVAGIALGLACAFRYASLFLVPAMLLLLWATRTSLRDAVRRGLAAAIPCVVLMGLTLGYVQWFSRSQKVLPAVVQVGDVEDEDEATTFEMVRWHMDNFIIASEMLLSSPVLQIVAGQPPVLRRVAGGATVGAVLLLAWLAWRRQRAQREKPEAALEFGVAASMVCLVLFLMTVQLGYFMGVPRYYVPLIFAGVLMWYTVASSRAPALLRYVAIAAVLAPLAFYTAMTVAGKRSTFFFVVMSFTGSDDVWKGSVFDTLRGLDNRIYTARDRTRALVAELYRKDPKAKFYIQSYYGFYTFDRGRSTGPTGFAVRGFPHKSFWPTAYTSEPLRVYWLVRTEQSLWFFPPEMRKLIHVDPREDVEVWFSDFPAGYRFGTSPQRAAL